MIVLRTPKGWTGPKEVDGLPVEGTWRSHQVPFAEVRTNPEHLALLEEWLRSYRPEELFDEDGAVLPEVTALAPDGDLRMSANPHANGGLLTRDLELPDFRDYAVEVPAPATTTSEATRVLGGWLRDVIRGQPRPVPDRGARRDGLEPAGGRVRGDRPPVGGRAAAHRRPPRARGSRDRGAVRAPVPGMARGLPADRPPRPVQLLRGVHPHRRLDVQPARQVAEDHAPHRVAPPHPVAELSAVQPRVAPGPQRVLPPGSWLHRPRGEQVGRHHPRVPARRTRTACCRWPTTACAAATTST